LFVYCPLSIQAADDNLFIDRFQGRGENWKISQTAGDGPSIERKEGGDRRGLHFVTNGLAVASAPWRVGTEPFELSFEVELDHGPKHPWRWPGVLVGLTSAEPANMQEDDIAIYFGAVSQGVVAGVRSGSFYGS
jgi:hypothetical protein